MSVCFTTAALDFYEDLANDNTKAFWEAHKGVYQTQVLAPMKALAAFLEPDFGTVKVMRPNRDTRFSADKSPYKTYLGASASRPSGAGWWVSVSAPGVQVGAGFYGATPARLASIRAAIDNPVTGEALVSMMTTLQADGYEIDGEAVKTAPRGYSADHPRIEWLRYKSMHIGREYGPDVITAPDFADRVRTDWETLRPYIDWLDATDN